MSYDKVIETIENYKLIYKCFLRLNLFYYNMYIPNEIFRKIIEYYYDYCIYEIFKCNRIKCLRFFKKYFEQNDDMKEYWYHCINAKCHRFFCDYESLFCMDCRQQMCPYCIKELEPFMYLCFECSPHEEQMMIEIYNFKRLNGIL